MCARSRERALRSHNRAIVRVLVLSACAAGCARTRPFQTPTGPQVRVLTCNVNWGGPKRERTLDAIRRAGADVVCLQETSPAWERFLRPRLAARYPHARFRHHGLAGGHAVFSRWPVAELDAMRPPGGFFPGWLLEAHTPIGPVQVLCVHLRPPCDERGRFGIRPYYWTKKVRLKEIQELFARLRPGLPTLILGDFNEKDNGPTLRWLGEQGFTDALREFDRSTPTWRWRYGLITLRGRLDHILCSRELRALEARVLRQGGSDHYPLLAVFERRTGRRGSSR